MKMKFKIIIILSVLVLVLLMIFPPIIILDSSNPSIGWENYSKCYTENEEGEKIPCKRPLGFPLNYLESIWIRYDEQSNWDEIFN